MTSTSTGASVVTRNKTNIWLIGQSLRKLNPTKLPFISEVLRLFFYYKNEERKTILESATVTACEVIGLCEKANIPIRLKKHVITKIRKHFKEWQNLKKNKENKNKRSEALKNKEQDWQPKLEDLFDIAHYDVLSIMTVEKDKQFLLLQVQVVIGSVDRKSLIKWKKMEEKEGRIKKLRERESKNISALTEKVLLSSSSFSSCDETSASDLEVASESPQAKPPQKRTRKDIFNRQLASSLDVCKWSDRKATTVVFNVNRSSIRQYRLKNQKAVAESLKTEFKHDLPLTIHWDEKLIEDVTGHKSVDRLPILVSGHGINQLLAVPKLKRGTSTACASAVYEAINSWGLRDKVKCLCFDTTAVNTGLINGACVKLEKKMKKDLASLSPSHFRNYVISCSESIARTG
ncbi:hypothetical protein RN001_015684 [Aquatica leii]|uniref:Uncharacterized protein n=1 Tax=Aquatica leii TaxID=1421715 RepID=A0AAN7SMR7_9COLE|nr:hypothetical protein RN001_015684 [Aquatica leii]